jgi:hypothetical protein
MFVLSNTCVTRDSSSLMIYVYLRAVSAVESMDHPSQQFVEDFLVHPRCLGWRIHLSPVIAIRL